LRCHVLTETNADSKPKSHYVDYVDLHAIFIMSFPCTQCGLCCQHIDRVEQLHDYHSGDGRCYFYIDNIGCSIYKHRPLVCRVDEGYEQLFSSLITKQDYYEKNSEACNSLQVAHGLDKIFRIIL
jgi:hypothetical protein